MAVPCHIPAPVVDTGMDVFLRTFLPAAAETGVPSPTVNRHLPVLRSCVRPGDAAALVAPCARSDEPASAGGYLLVLTYRRLVVTRQSRLLRQVRLHLNAELRHLGNVAWSPDARTSTIELAATAVDGIRERFLVRAGRPSRMWQLDALFEHLFRPRVATADGIAAAVGGTATASGVGDAAGRVPASVPAQGKPAARVLVGPVPVTPAARLSPAGAR